MIGISIFSFSRCMLCAAGFMSAAIAADVTLYGDSRLSGELISMDSSGTLTLSTSISKDPVKINASSLKSVSFSAPENATPVPDQRLELINGDVLPVRVEALDENLMTVDSETFGRISVPRDLIFSLQLGIVPEKVIYRASDNLQQWRHDSTGSQEWNMEDGIFTADGQATTSRDMKLPEKFILRFTLSWTQHPNFRMYFADPYGSPGKRADRYYLQYAGAGLEVRRESTGNPRDTPIVTIGRTPDRFPDSRVPIELRVDRARGTLQIYIDGILEGRYTDPVSNIPKGGGLIMMSLIPRNATQVISDLEILDWDESGDRHRTESRGNDSTDSLIGRHGERFSGSLSGIRPSATGAIFEFKTDFKKENIELPEQEVSTVFFAGKESDRSQKGYEGLILRLRGGGEMRVSACEFTEDSVQAIHPLLGKIDLVRAGISSLERRTIPKAKPVESK